MPTLGQLQGRGGPGAPSVVAAAREYHERGERKRDTGATLFYGIHLGPFHGIHGAQCDFQRRTKCERIEEVL